MSKEKIEPKEEIKNLCEDMTHHEHDDKSYQKMLKEQEKQRQENNQSKSE